MSVSAYTVYNSAADLPPFLDQTGDCRICLSPIDEAAPIPEVELVAPAAGGQEAQGSLRQLCAPCARTSQGAPLSTEDTAVVSHTDAKGMDRYHFQCLRNYFLKAPHDSNCVTCREPFDSSTLLTKTEAESMQFQGAAQQRLTEINRSIRQWKELTDYRLFGFDKGYGYVAFCCARTCMMTIGASMAIVNKFIPTVRGSELTLERPITEFACLIVGASVGGYFSRSLAQLLKERPLDEAASIDKGPARDTDHCSLCREPLQRAPHVLLERPCAGSLKTCRGEPICETSVARHVRTSGLQFYHLFCARKQLHQDVLAQTEAARIFKHKDAGVLLLTREEGVIAYRIEKSKRAEVFARRFHEITGYSVPITIADTLFSLAFPVLRGIARGEWTSANALSDLAFVGTCVSVAHLGMFAGFTLYSTWARYRGLWLK